MPYADRTMVGMLNEAKHAAQILGMQLQFVPASSPEDITGAFSMMTRDRADALCVFPSPMLYAEYGRIVRMAADKMLPTIYAAREGVELLATSSRVQQLNGQIVQSTPTVAPTTGVFCIEEMTATFCNVVTGPNTSGYGSRSVSTSSSRAASSGGSLEQGGIDGLMAPAPPLDADTGRSTNSATDHSVVSSGCVPPYTTTVKAP